MRRSALSGKPPGMSDHTEQADQLDAEAEKLEQRSEALGDDISRAKDTWESHKRDPAVPGAVGDALGENEEGLEPEAQYASKGDSESGGNKSEGEDPEREGGDGPRAESSGDEGEPDDGRRAGSPGDEDS